MFSWPFWMSDMVVTGPMAPTTPPSVRPAAASRAGLHRLERGVARAVGDQEGAAVLAELDQGAEDGGVGQPRDTQLVEQVDLGEGPALLLGGGQLLLDQGVADGGVGVVG